MTASMPSAVPTTAALRGDLVDNLSTFVAAGGLTAAATTINVDSTSAWPTAGLLSLRKASGTGSIEVCSYTGVTATSFTGVIRNVNGRYNGPFSEDDVVELFWVADFHNRHVEETIALASFLDTHIGKGTAVTAAQFERLVGVTSGIQTQLDSKIGAASPTFTGVVTTANGSVSAPALNFGDSGSGLYRSAANQIAIALSGVVKFNLATSVLSVYSAASAGTANGIIINNITAGVGGCVAVQDNGTSKMWLGTVASINGGSDLSAGLVANTGLGIKMFVNGSGTPSFTIASTGAVSIQGTATNDNAAAGDIGQYIESVASATSLSATDTYGDLTSISLTAGDWNVTALCEFLINGATITQVRLGISVTAGNSGTGLVDGSNLITSFLPTANYRGAACIANYRLSLSATTTVYMKTRGSFSVATPTAAGRISARRVR